MLLIIITIYKHSTTYKNFFITVVNSEHSFTALTNTVLLKVTAMLNFFFINIKFITLNSV